MGYANTIPYSTIQVDSNNADEVVTLTAVSGTQVIGQGFDVPLWVRERLKHAYLRMTVERENNTDAGGYNWTFGNSYIQVDTDTLGWHNALLIPTASFKTPTLSACDMHFEILGLIDLVPLGITATTVTMQWTTARALSANLELFGVKFSLYCILE